MDTLNAPLPGNFHFYDFALTRRKHYRYYQKFICVSIDCYLVLHDRKTILHVVK